MDGRIQNITAGPAIIPNREYCPSCPTRVRATSLVGPPLGCASIRDPLILRKMGKKQKGQYFEHLVGFKSAVVLLQLAMAEICLGVARGQGETGQTGETELCEKGYQVARLLEIRHMRCIAGVGTMGKPLGVDLSLKKQRSELPVHPRIVLQKNNSGEVKGAAASEVGLNPDPVISASVIESVFSEKLPRYGMKSIRGRRTDMEDAVSIRPDFLRRRDRAFETHHFFGVFDGHGCSHVAAWCKDRLHEMVTEEVEKLELGPHPPPVDWKVVMDRSFSRMDEEVVGWTGVGPRTPYCRCELRNPNSDHVGTTAIVAVVTSDRIVIANCGDSRAVLCRQGAAVPLSIDHKPDRPDEQERIERAGGRVIFWDGPRVLGVLAMSRAIGDGYLKQYVTAEPEVTVTERDELDDECLILASDGLWDVVANETACEVVRMCLQRSRRGGNVSGGTEKACSDAASLLTKLALARNSTDNVSVVVVDLRRNPL